MCELPKEKAMATHSSTLTWKIPWVEEPGGLQSMGSLRVGHDWVTSLSLFTFMHWSKKWQPTPVFLPGESQGRGSLVGCHLRGRTRVKSTEVPYQQNSPIHRTLLGAWGGYMCSHVHDCLCITQEEKECLQSYRHGNHPLNDFISSEQLGKHLISLTQRLRWFCLIHIIWHHLKIIRNQFKREE